MEVDKERRDKTKEQRRATGGVCTKEGSRKKEGAQEQRGGERKREREGPRVGGERRDGGGRGGHGGGEGCVESRRIGTRARID